MHEAGVTERILEIVLEHAKEAGCEVVLPVDSVAAQEVKENAENKVVGRLATQIAMRLRGKHKPIYSPHMETGDFVVVVNAEKVKITGNNRTWNRLRDHMDVDVSSVIEGSETLPAAGERIFQ